MLASDTFSDPLLPPHSLQKETAINGANNTSSNDTSGLQLAKDNLKTADSSAFYIADNDATRKRNYLALLPPDQIIELCLTFEQHVPLPIRASLWPPDLDVEILKLRKNASRIEPETGVTPPASLPDGAAQGSQPPSDTPLPQVHPPGDVPSLEPAVQPADTAVPTAATDESQTPNSSDSTTPDTAEATPQPYQSLASVESSTTELAARTSISAGKDATRAQPSAPASSTSTQPEHANTTISTPAPTPASNTPQHLSAPLAPYPYAPYGYPLPAGYSPSNNQAAYPHAPYYAPPNSSAPGYIAPYSGYSHYPPQPGYPTHVHQPPPPPNSNEDLPSYEDMIVEALMDIGDPDGAAPRDLFLWMGSRWPLQTNFRPSASQALQKAYKRGRLEKTDGGRYRLNPSWEGGATSKRTTRRPQTLAQTTYALHHPSSQTPSSSPFTHAPLPHRSHTSPPPAHPPQHQPYPGYTFPYGSYPSFAGYTPYNPHIQAKPPTVAAAPPPPAAAKPSATAKPAVKTVLTTGGKDKDVPASDEDAWEAAQHILKAINFGLDGLLPSSAVKTSAAVPGQSATATSLSNAAPPPTTPVSTGAGVGAEDDGLGRATLTDEERASLQAQLALLAAQLSEIAAEAVDDDEDMSEEEEVPPLPLPQQNQLPQVSRTIVVTSADVKQPSPPTSTMVDVNQFPDDGLTDVAPGDTTDVDPPADVTMAVAPAADGNGEESDEDEDMEMVDVDSYMRGSNGLKA